MTYRAVLRGYLLEEALAWLLRNAGYRLLVHDSQDLDELITKNGALHVKGRGAPFAGQLRPEGTVRRGSPVEKKLTPG